MNMSRIHHKTPYGRSNMMQSGADGTCQKCGMAVTIIRPPLIYGKGCEINFASMLKHMVHTGFPPLARLKNARSLLALPNLCDFIVSAIDHPLP